MANETGNFDTSLMEANMEALADNPYPGRGIVLGVSEGGEQAVQAYWVMGRSDNSRNRILAEVDGVVRTEAFDPSKVEDPSLIIYNALVTARLYHGSHIVSNGDQTDTVHERLMDASSKGDRDVHDSFRSALFGRVFEPDPPNFTPRITGMIFPGNNTYDYSIIRRNPVTEQAEHTFGGGKLGDIPEGAGICFHTYETDSPSKSEPIPSFEGGPYAVPVGETADDFADSLWGVLNEENRVALAVKTIDLFSGEIAIKLVNQLEE